MSDVAAFTLQRLKQWGIHRVFGYPGDGINGFLGAFEEEGNDPEFIQPRHEEMAAFMATGHAKFTGEIGVCIATSGPGAIHLLNGLYDAKLDHQPVLAIVGQQKRFSIGANYQQEVDLQTLFKDVSEYCTTITHPAQARHAIDRAVRIALATRAPSVLIFPDDVQEEEAVPSPPRMHGSVYSSVGYTKPRILPPDEELRRAAEILNTGEKVAILIGQGAAEATNEVLEAADVLGAGIAKALLGKSAVPDDIDIVTGPIGLLGSEASHKMVMGCDTLFMIGTSFPYAEWLPEEGQAKCVEIDIDARYIGIRYPADVHLVGDAKETLRALLPMLERKEERSWQDFIRSEVATWWRVVEDQSMLDGDPINPMRVAWELNKRLPDGAIVCADSGSSTTWFARQLMLRRGMKASLSGTLATMGPATPYAIAAKFAFPDRPVIAFIGDGAFEMNGMNEMLTVHKYWRSHFKTPTLVFAVFRNGDLNQVSYEQRVLSADPVNPATQFIPKAPFADWANSVGLLGLHCDRPEAVGDVWAQALQADRPVVIEFDTDPEMPPLPPHVKPAQMKKTAKALASGDPQAVGIATKGFKGKWQEFKEHMPGAGSGTE